VSLQKSNDSLDFQSYRLILGAIVGYWVIK